MCQNTRNINGFINLNGLWLDRPNEPRCSRMFPGFRKPEGVRLLPIVASEKNPPRMGAYRLFDRIAAKPNAGGAELLISARASMEPDPQLGLRSQDVSIIGSNWPCWVNVGYPEEKHWNVARLAWLGAAKLVRCEKEADHCLRAHLVHVGCCCGAGLLYTLYL
jgi:hypothetical protein